MSARTRKAMEYRITGSPDGGYWSGVAGRTWTDEGEARAALADYQHRVNADHFILERARVAHLAAVHIEAREVKAWESLDTRPTG